MCLLLIVLVIINVKLMMCNKLVKNYRVTLNQLITSVTRSGDLLDLGQLLNAFGNT